MPSLAFSCDLVPVVFRGRLPVSIPKRFFRYIYCALRKSGQANIAVGGYRFLGSRSIYPALDRRAPIAMVE